MKVVHITQSCSGGAGLAAFRLHSALLASGTDSHILCLSGGGKNVHKYDIPLWAKVLSHISVPYRQNKYMRYYADLMGGSGSYESVTFPEAIYDITRHPIVQSADVVNLHWEGNMLHYPSFFKKISKPVVWTLHDMNPFCGIAHYSHDIEANPSYLWLEDKIRKIKESAIRSNANIYVVELCPWMQGLAKKSKAFEFAFHTIIPNSINPNVFKPYNRNAVRQIFDLPLNEPVLLCCGQNLNVKRKGFDLLQKAISNLGEKCTLVTIGRMDDVPRGVNYRPFGTVADGRLMAMLYAGADACLIPSREDNLPNTMLEALLCGTPVIAFPVGGMASTIRNYENGLLAEDVTSEALAYTIKLFLQNRDAFVRSEIAHNARMIFSPDKQAKSYIELYEKAVANYK